MNQAKVKATSPRDLYATMAANTVAAVRIVQEAASKKKTVTQILNEEMGITPKDASEGLDGFERLMEQAGIQPVSDHANGIHASSASKFVEGSRAGDRLLLTEFVARIQRSVTGRKPASVLSRATSLAEVPIGSLQRPYHYEPEVFWTQEVAPAIPLSAVVSRSQGIDEFHYQSYHVTYSAAGLRLTRVEETAKVPMANLTKSTHVINLHKYARGMEISVERMKALQVDEFAIEVMFVLAQMEVDKLAAFIDVAVNGDGNAGTAATVHNLTTLDTNATANNLTSRAYRAFRRKFTEAYIMRAILAQDAMVDQLEEVNIGSANIPLADARVPAGHQLAPINTVSPVVAYGWTADAPANNFVGFDTRRSPKHVFHIGDYQETQKQVETMTEIMVLAEWSGFAVIDANGTRVLDNSA